MGTIDWRWIKPEDDGYFNPGDPSLPISECCTETFELFECTRLKNHDGPHAAHGLDRTQFIAWTDDYSENGNRSRNDPTRKDKQMASMQKIDEDEMIDRINGLIAPDRYSRLEAIDFLETIKVHLDDLIEALKAENKNNDHRINPVSPTSEEYLSPAPIDTLPQQCCTASWSGYLCTRFANHKGKHAAHGMDGTQLVSWN